MPKIKIPKAVRLILKILLTGGAVYFVIRNIDLQEVVDTFRRSRLVYIPAALGLFVLSKGIAAFRLNRYFRGIEITLSDKTNLRLYLLGMFYNLFLPGGIGGDGYKIYYLRKRHEIKTGRIFWAVMLDRVNGVLALFCLAAAFAFFIDIPRGMKYAILMLIPASLLITRYIYGRFFPQFRDIFARTSLLSFAVQLLQVLSAWFLLLSFGVKQQEVVYLFVFLVSSIVAIFPLTIGGVGAREFTFLLGAQWLGLDINLSVALSFLFYLITAFTSFWGIVYSLNPGLLEKHISMEEPGIR